MDPLSHIVSLLHPHDCVAAAFDAGGDWAIQFEPHEGLKCNAVIEGRCWIAVEGEDPVELTKGDCAILPRGRAFVLSAKPARSGRDAQILYAPVRNGGTAVFGNGGEFYMSGARFLLSGQAAKTLMASLPSLIVLRDGGASSDDIRWCLDGLARELRARRAGGVLSIGHLSHLLLLQVLRQHLNAGPQSAAGWLAALADSHVSKAVAAVYDDPARAWTVQDMAREAGLSRTAFAVRFREVTGQSPIEHLTEWRMLQAAAKLREGRWSVGHIAREVGYASESAFTVAFKRVLGQSPRSFAKAVKAETDRS